jgi:hypothetical protein
MKERITIIMTMLLLGVVLIFTNSSTVEAKAKVKKYGSGQEAYKLYSWSLKDKSAKKRGTIKTYMWNGKKRKVKWVETEYYDYYNAKYHEVTRTLDYPGTQFTVKKADAKTAKKVAAKLNKGESVTLKIKGSSSATYKKAKAIADKISAGVDDNQYGFGVGVSVSKYSKKGLGSGGGCMCYYDDKSVVEKTFCKSTEYVAPRMTEHSGNYYYYHICAYDVALGNENVNAMKSVIDEVQADAKAQVAAAKENGTTVPVYIQTVATTRFVDLSEALKAWVLTQPFEGMNTKWCTYSLTNQDTSYWALQHHSWRGQCADYAKTEEQMYDFVGLKAGRIICQDGCDHDWSYVKVTNSKGQTAILVNDYGFKSTLYSTYYGCEHEGGEKNVELNMTLDEFLN